MTDTSTVAASSKPQGAPTAAGWRIYALLGDDLRAPWVHHQAAPNDSAADWPGPKLTARCLFHGHEAADPECACGVYATEDLHQLLPRTGGSASSPGSNCPGESCPALTFLATTQ